LAVSLLVVSLKQPDCFGSFQGKFCYTDIYVLYWNRGLKDGLIPIIQSDLEYPVLTGAFIQLAQAIARLFGAQAAPDLAANIVQSSAVTFFWVNAALLFICYALLVWVHLHFAKPIGAFMIGISPAIWLSGLVNWDALVILLASAALLAWSRKHPAWAGIFIGLGVAAKLYPLLFLVPLGVLCLRASRWREYFITCYACVLAWAAVNLPYFWLAPARWLEFWTFNVDRGSDWGSIWYVLYRFGIRIDNLSLIEAVLMVAGTAVICVLMLRAPVRPRLAQGVFLITVWFLVINKVYSPQYVLWLLPLLVLARPRWLDWALFSVAESLYYFEIWIHLTWLYETYDFTTVDWPYALSVFLRIGVQLYICGRVIADMYRPARDIVRIDGEGPDEGILAGCADAKWLRRFIGNSAPGVRAINDDAPAGSGYRAKPSH
jgi:uncharacterized membrane protein